MNSSPMQTVAGAALVVSIAGIVSRLLGLFRDRILASQFGAGDILDVYYAAFRVPDIIYNLLIVGALSAAFIPVFTGLITKKNNQRAWQLASGLLTLQIFAVGIISLLLAIFAPQVMKFITPGFSEEKIQEVVHFTRIMFLSPLFLGISAVFGGILVSFKRFLVYSLAPIMYNLGIIIGAVFFVKIMGPIGLAWGVALGAFLHLSIQYPAAKFSGFYYQARNIKKIFSDKNIRKVVKLMIPRSLAMGVAQINLLIVTIFASVLASGSLTAFNFANNLQSVPLGLFGISFSIAVFPQLSVLAIKNNKQKFISIFSQTFRRILFFVLPTSVIIFTLRAEIVRVALGGGEFDWADTKMTLWILGILSLSLFAQSTIPLLARSFYALENTKIPFYVALFSESVNVSLMFLLVEKFKILGLAVAFSVASIINMVCLFYFLRKQFGQIDGKIIFNSIFKILIASLFAGIAVYLARHFLGVFIELKTFLEVLTQLIISGGAGLSAFLLACYWLKIKEFNDFSNSILIRVLGRSGEISNQ